MPPLMTSVFLGPSIMIIALVTPMPPVLQDYEKKTITTRRRRQLGHNTMFFSIFIYIRFIFNYFYSIMDLVIY